MADRRYIMIGAPLTSVRTPRMLEERMAAAGMRARVELHHVEPDGLAVFMRRIIGESTVDGLMVTMPHKRSMLPYLADVSSTAALIGSVNAVKRLNDGGLAGAQFDGVALVRALETAGQDVRDARVLLAGLGGAGTAIARALLARGCRSLAVHDEAMDGTLIKTVLGHLSAGLPDVPATAWDGGDGFDILVNATPLGMTDHDPSPFTAGQVAAARCIADIVADPPATRLAALAEEADVPLVTGRAMVAAQIEPIFNWLRTPDVEQ